MEISLQNMNKNFKQDDSVIIYHAKGNLEHAKNIGRMLWEQSRWIKKRIIIYSGNEIVFYYSD